MGHLLYFYWLHAHSTCSRFLAVWFPMSGILFLTYSPFWYYCPPLLVTLFVTLFVHHTTPHFGICAHWPQICHAPRWPIPPSLLGFVTCNGFVTIHVVRKERKKLINNGSLEQTIYSLLATLQELPYDPRNWLKKSWESQLMPTLGIHLM